MYSLCLWNLSGEFVGRLHFDDEGQAKTVYLHCVGKSAKVALHEFVPSCQQWRLVCANSAWRSVA